MFKLIVFIVLGANIIVLCPAWSDAPCTHKSPVQPCAAKEDNKHNCTGCGEINKRRACESTCKSIRCCKNYDDTNETAEQRILNANTAINGICLYQKIRTNPGENVIVSVFQLVWYFSMLVFYSEGSTREELMCLLNVKSEDEIPMVFGTFFEIMKSDTSFKAFSKVYTDIKYPLSKNFTLNLKNIFHSQTGNVNFNNPIEAAAIMNYWVRNVSRKPCANLITSDEINKNNGLTFIGTSTFNGIFREDFRIKNEIVMDFRVSKNKIIKSPAYYCEGQVKYYTDNKLGANMVVLPFQSNHSGVVVWADDLEELLFKIRKPNVLNDLFNKGIWMHIGLDIPFRKNINGTNDFVRGIKLSGYLHQMLDYKFNCFSGIYENNKKSGYIANMKQDIHLSCQNAPEKLLSTTEPENCSDGKPNLPHVKVDRPYVYFILCSKGATIISGIHYNSNSL